MDQKVGAVVLSEKNCLIAFDYLRNLLKFTSGGRLLMRIQE